jgi:hypothetical protein
MLHHSLNATDLRRAILEYQHAAHTWAECGDMDAELLALGGKAESEIGLSRYASAQHTLTLASHLAETQSYLNAWLLHLATSIHLDLWEGKEASDSAQEELRLSQQTQDPAAIALARADLSGSSFWTDFSHSHVIAEQARAEAMAAGMPEALGLEGKWMAWIEEREEIKLGSLQALSESVSNFSARWGQTCCKHRRCGTGRCLDNRRRSIFGARAIPGTGTDDSPNGNVVLYGQLLGNIGDVMRQIGRPKPALSYYYTTNVDFERIGFRMGILPESDELV